jgi:beta-glucanase (GH16 family)
VVGSGGSVGSAGGSTANGGATGNGGAQATGGSNGNGGVVGSGGSVGNAGGSTANGGATGNGGAQATGGSNGSGGSVGSGGAVGTGGASGTGGTSASKCPAGWNLAWSDEFDGPAGTAANGTNWVYETGNNNGWGNSELEYYQAGNANGALDGNGNFVITSKQETVGGFNYTSARLKTQGKFSWTYGHFEARIKIPYGQGMWPAFWMMGSTGGGWPACGEIDIMESLGKEPNIVHGTMHGPGYSGAQGPTASTTMPGPAKLADDFHVFAVEWETNVIRWYFDGQLYSTKTPTDIGAGNTWVFDHPFYFLINNAVGGGWPGNPDTTTVFPQKMTIDYVRVCQR